MDLRLDNLVSMPDQGWGELILTNSEPRSGTWWTDNGSARQRRELKHRPRGETRLVPLHPELVALLTQHLQKHPRGQLRLGHVSGTASRIRGPLAASDRTWTDWVLRLVFPAQDPFWEVVAGVGFEPT